LYAQPLHKNDLERYTPMFALYLDIQKQIEIETLSEVEVKGRWKSFMGKWYVSSQFLSGCASTEIMNGIVVSCCSSLVRIKTNMRRNRGELAEGWYDPSTLEKAIEAGSNTANESSGQKAVSRGSPNYGALDATKPTGNTQDDSDSDDIGPSLPSALDSTTSFLARNSGPRSGPSIPNFEELELKRGSSCLISLWNNPQLTSAENAVADAESNRLAQKAERKLARKEANANLEELAPRAAAGTRERALEKKAELASSNRAFAAVKDDGGGVAEVGDAELLGGDDTGVEGFKAQKREMERRKNERELRRDDMLRAKEQERLERTREYREKEDRVVAELRELAQRRFG
jgi:hypothetical protein